MNRNVRAGDVITNALGEQENEFTGIIISVEQTYAGGFNGTVIGASKSGKYPVGYGVVNWNDAGRHWDLVEEQGSKEHEIW